MKKLLIFLLLCFFIMPVCIFADDDEEAGEEVAEEYEDPFNDAPKKPVRLPGRVFEIGMNFDVAFSNTYLSVLDYFKETIVLDIDKLSSGFKTDVGANVRPFYFMIDSKKGWGFGISTDVNAFGIVDLNGAMLSFDESKGDESTASGAVFASLGIDTFFQIEKFKVKLRPALYYTAAFVKTDISYKFLNSDSGTSLGLAYDMYIYTAFPIDNIQPNELTGTPGFDISFGIEYPLSKEMGLSSSLLDFDVGVDFINVPVIISTLKNFRRIQGSFGNDVPINIIGEDGLGDFISSITEEDKTETNGIDNISVERPFKALLYANWRPAGKQSLVITPVFGFGLNRLYLEPFGIEAGINICLNTINVFITTIGINYTDRAWSNSIDFAFNLRAFEINIGARMRSQDFIKSWTGYGVGANVGLKLGW